MQRSMQLNVAQVPFATTVSTTAQHAAQHSTQSSTQLTVEHVLFTTTVPSGRVSASASRMPWDEPVASTATSKACARATAAMF